MTKCVFKMLKEWQQLKLLGTFTIENACKRNVALAMAMLFHFSQLDGPRSTWRLRFVPKLNVS